MSANFFTDLADIVAQTAALTACNMAPISRTYELDTALLTCFQPEEMYGYPDVLEVLGKE